MSSPPGVAIWKAQAREIPIQQLCVEGMAGDARYVEHRVENRVVAYPDRPMEFR